MITVVIAPGPAMKGIASGTMISSSALAGRSSSREVDADQFEQLLADHRRAGEQIRDGVGALWYVDVRW